MRPPSLALLQMLNVCQGLGTFLAAMTATAAWNRAGWSDGRIGMAMMLANLCYAVVVGFGGRLSDRWGRARTASLGAAVSAAGCAAGLVAGGPGGALVAAVIAFAGSALFFPGNAGLFSDASDPAALRHLPLHVKIARYNLGWGGGNLGGFLGYALLAHRPVEAGFALAGAVCFGVALVAARWARLPPRPPPAEGDRAPHPWLPRLTLAARLGLVAATASTFAFVALLQTALQGVGLPPAEAQRRGGIVLLAYALAYLGMFALLGTWSGWILRPWRMWALQFGLLAGGGGLLVLGLAGWASAAALAACGVAAGLSFGAAFTNSLFHSLRLPERAGRASSLHETCLGVGNTLGPLLGGAAMAWWSAHGAGGGLAGLGAFMAASGMLCLALQAALIARLPRAG